MNLDRPDHVPADQLEWYLSRHSLTLGSSEGSKTLVVEPRDEALDVLRTILNSAGPDDAQLKALRKIAQKALTESDHSNGWHVGEMTEVGTVSTVYTPDRVGRLPAHRLIACNMTEADAQYVASLHPSRFLSILDQLDRLEDTASQAVADQEAAQLQLHNIGRLHQPVTVAVGRFESVQGDPIPADAKLEEHCRTCHTVFPCETARALNIPTPALGVLDDMLGLAGELIDTKHHDMEHTPQDWGDELEEAKEFWAARRTDLANLLTVLGLAGGQDG